MNITIPIETLRKSTIKTYGGKAFFPRKGAVFVDPEKEISEIQKELGLDRTRPITLSANDQKEAEDTSGYFKDWYEEELRAFNESKSE